jgi:hypothetical protein
VQESACSEKHSRELVFIDRARCGKRFKGFRDGTRGGLKEKKVCICMSIARMRRKHKILIEQD